MMKTKSNREQAMIKKGGVNFLAATKTPENFETLNVLSQDVFDEAKSDLK